MCFIMLLLEMPSNLKKHSYLFKMNTRNRKISTFNYLKMPTSVLSTILIISEIYYI